jgi:hypothetical protein
MYRIASLDVDDESDIDWNTLVDTTWNMWSGHFLQQKWRRIKASCNAGVMCHRGVYMTFIPPVHSALMFLIEAVNLLVAQTGPTFHSDV